MEKVAQVKQDVKQDVKGQVQANANVAAKDAAKEAEKKAKKNEAAKRHSEKVKSLREQSITVATKLQAYIAKTKPTFDGIDVVNKWITDVLSGGSNGGGQNFFNKVFGDSPKVGDKITLMDFMKKTLKGKADFDAYVKKWAEKGIIVKFDAGSNMFESTYTIEKLA